MKKYIGLIIGMLPLIVSAQMVLTNNYYAVLSGGSSANPTSVVLTNPTPSGITNTGTGWIVSENEFNQVVWQIGTNTGTYVVPFGYSSLQYLPVTLNISNAGTGSGVVKFSTYHSAALNTPFPSDVTNDNAFILPGSPSNTDDSYNIADRFYVIDATGYATKPAAGNITFSYISGTANSEVAAPNVLVESHLMAERFNSTSDTWSDWFAAGCTDNVVANVGTVQTGPVPAIDMYRSWALWDNLTPLPLSYTSTDVVCNGNSTGAITVTISGGVSPYTYTWTPNVSSSSTATGLSAGTYTVSVADNTGCTSTIGPITITQPSAIDDSIIAASVVNELCNGNSMGSATVGISGGAAPYTYNWTPNVSSTATASGLTAGTYSVNITDNNGCTSSTTSVTITQPDIIDDSIVAASVVNVTCNGGSNGSATVGVIGGTGAYTYNWTPNVGSTATASGLTAGTYSVNITDNNGCTSSTTSVTITQPNIIDDSIVAASVINVSCNGGSNGSATVGVIGGTGAYTYNWTPNVSSTATASGLAAGTYSVNITDNNGCTSSTTSVTITQPNIIDDSIVAASVINVSCNGGSNGSATVGVSRGIAPYTYNWTPNVSSTATASGLSAGTYSVNITDNNGCTSSTTSVTITQPNIIDDSIVAASVINVSCNGGSNGSVMVGVIGGTAPYTYNWTPNVSSTATASGLSAGTYSVNITDNNGCTSSTTSVTITQPNIIDDSIVTASVVNVSCNGLSNGSAMVGVIGGTGAYTYNWTPNVSSTATASGLSAGTYSVNITDANGCSGTSVSVTITQPAVLNDSIVSVATINVVCKGDSTGSITVGATGGTQPYTYNWTPNVSSMATATGLSAGTYSVDVTDNNGCSGPMASVTITQPYYRLLDSVAVLANVGCYQGNQGEISIGTRGGVAPYTYVWTPNVSSIYAASGLSAGTYTVSITDNIGCNHMMTVTVTQPSATLMDSVSSVSSPTCNGGLGTATIGVAGGTPSYSYLWTPDGYTTATVSTLSAGTYTVIVNDSHGCNASCSVTVIQTIPIVTSITSVTEVSCNGNSSGSATVGVSGGTSPYTYTWTPNVSSTNVATGLSAGSYSVTVTDNNGCSSSAMMVTITQPAPLSDNVVVLSNVGCNGGSGGSASVNVSGGSGPYAYLWTPGGETTYSVSGLTAGTYTVNVSDNNGCNNIAYVTITEPAPLKDTVTSITNLVCSGLGSDATVGTIGGTSPYTYAWNPNVSTTASCSSLNVGVYTVTVTDANGCMATCTVDISQPAPIYDSIVSALTIEVSCQGGSNGSATVGVRGGFSPYTYTWTPNVSSTATATGLSAGTYSVIVNDSHGCSGNIATVTITQPANGIKDSVAVLVNVGCNGGSGGSVSIGTRGGAGPYTYQWSPNVSSIYHATGLSAGTYSVTVTDNNGCSNTIAVTVTQPASALAVSLTGSTNPVCYGGTGSASVSASGGTSPYTYQWTSAWSTTNSASGMPAGTYIITVNDANGCNATTSVTITQPAQMIVNTVYDNVTSHAGGGCNGIAGITSIVGGTPPYTYLWTGGQTTDSITRQCAGDYCVTVTDANGCSVNTCIAIATTVGIPTITGSSSISVYPDPTNGMFTVSGVIQGQIIELYNAIGQQLSRVVADNTTMHFNIADKADGVYLIRILYKDGTIAGQTRMIKTK